MRNAIDPRRYGTIYWSRYWQTVNHILEAIEEDGIRTIVEITQSPPSDVVRTHLTHWDPKDEVLYQPGARD